MNYWQTLRRRIHLDRPLVMAILNVTPDSFSDGGKFARGADALKHAERLIAEGADIIDIGGESTRPGSSQVSVADELERVIPVIEAVAARFDVPVSIDTTKSAVAERAVEAGAEIINDISGLRFEPAIADVAAGSGAGLVLMHSRGAFEEMHVQPPVDDIVAEVVGDLYRAIAAATKAGVAEEKIALDVGIGFGKTFEQNLELLSKLGAIVKEFAAFPLLVGASRKSFIGKILGDAPQGERVAGSVAAAIIAIQNGARIVRVHDVQQTVEAIKVLSAISQA